ncbi:MAG TPA: Trk system potassium transporter TrkA [Candidatus Copromonas faecavium]|uniref:Trk system potassium uptake protein TrkA n=1 Tax=Candidatus Copromonas faecavium (nom. illeg.) TaxID=2840740 RepID=A0A9D1A2D1_9FIRM|nr:Trk system potassium transporter TrkA [Candidatus Copromonas faecavium]
MNIIIVGCGKVGASLAERLSAEDHDLVLVDLNPQKVEELSNQFDAMGIVGNGASFNIQQEAGVEHADLFIAVTGADELNLLCCLMAKKSGHCQTIARVRNPMYNQEIRFIKEQLGISMIINPELTAAKEILKLLKFPSAIKIDTFAKGRVELLRFRLKPEIGFGGKAIVDIIDRLKTDVLICAVERGTDVVIPNGSFVLQDNDILSIVGSLENTSKFFEQIGLKPKTVKNSLIVGGGTIAHYLTQNLLKIGFRVRIIEQNPERCEYLSEHLPGADIINGDASNESLLLEEGLSTADSFVALTGMDEENIFLSLFAKKHSKGKTIAKVNRIAFNDIIDSLDIGSIVYPKYLTADYILQYVRAWQNSIGSNVETLYKILDGRAEALEFSIREPSAVTDVPLMDLNLKDNLLICCINRKGVILTPRGQNKIKVGDTVIIVTTNRGLHDIRDILKG